MSNSTRQLENLLDDLRCRYLKINEVSRMTEYAQTLRELISTVENQLEMAHKMDEAKSYDRC